jgi:hypothetical protein
LFTVIEWVYFWFLLTLYRSQGFCRSFPLYYPHWDVSFFPDSFSFKTCTWTIHFLLRAHGSFSKINHNLWHKASLNKYKKIEITPCILSEHSIIKLDLNNKRSSRNSQMIGVCTTCCSMINGSYKE